MKPTMINANDIPSIIEFRFVFEFFLNAPIINKTILAKKLIKPTRIINTPKITIVQIISFYYKFINCKN